MVDDPLDPWVEPPPKTAWTAMGAFYQRWLPPLILTLCVLWLAYVLVFRPAFRPPIGVYIGTLGFLAAIVTIFPPASNWAKAFWLAVLFSLAVLEIANLYQDRAENQKQQIQARTDEDIRFGQILAQDQKQFDSTMEKSGKIFDKTQVAADTATEAVNVLTGGKGFCFVEMAVFHERGKVTDRVMPFLEVKNTKVLRDLKIRVLDYKAFQADTSPVTMENVDSRDAATVFLNDARGVTPLTQPLGISGDIKVDKDYVIQFWALNGNWNEEIHTKYINGEQVEAIQVKWVDYPPDNNVFHTKSRTIFEQVSKGYPRVNGKVGWANLEPAKRP